MNEMIMAVKSSAVDCCIDGFHQVDTFEFVLRFCPAGSIIFGERETLETDESFRQIVVYVLTMKGDNILCYQRSKKGGEDRLHNLQSFGIGGHVNIGDIVQLEGQILIADTLWQACNREYNEELNMSLISSKLVGILKLSETVVDRVHLGMVYISNIDVDMFEHDETITNLRWVKKYKAGQVENLETWSQTLVPFIQSLEV